MKKITVLSFLFRSLPERSMYKRCCVFIMPSQQWIIVQKIASQEIKPSEGISNSLCLWRSVKTFFFPTAINLGEFRTFWTFWYPRMLLWTHPLFKKLCEAPEGKSDLAPVLSRVDRQPDWESGGLGAHLAPPVPANNANLAFYYSVLQLCSSVRWKVCVQHLLLSLQF